MDVSFAMGRVGVAVWSYLAKRIQDGQKRTAWWRVLVLSDPHIMQCCQFLCVRGVTIVGVLTGQCNWDSSS
jgi:hypothetical protein